MKENLDRDGEEYHILKEKPMILTEKGIQEFLDKSRIIDYSNDILLTGYQIFHTNSKGDIREVKINTREYWDILDTLSEYDKTRSS